MGDLGDLFLRESGASTKRKFFCYIAQKLKYLKMQWNYLLSVNCICKLMVSVIYMNYPIHKFVKKLLFNFLWISSEETFPCFAGLSRYSWLKFCSSFIHNTLLDCGSVKRKRELSRRCVKLFTFFGLNGIVIANCRLAVIGNCISNDFAIIFLLGLQSKVQWHTE